jgi:hypothetical protein
MDIAANKKVYTLYVSLYLSKMEIQSNLPLSLPSSLFPWERRGKIRGLTPYKI